MGLIKSIFGTIFGLLGGIFKTVGGLVGLGKKSEFFMELDESDSSAQPAALPAPAETKSVAAPAKATTKAPAQASAKAATKAPAKAATKAPAKAAPAPVATAPAEPVPTAFASTYLTTVGTSLPRRRRPGPSLSPFLNMAKQVKTR